MEEYKFTFKKLLLHLKTIIKHRFYVFIYCCRCGIVWQGLTHDLSKFSPSEFIANVKYTENGISPIDIQKNHIGYSYPWMHHKGHNPHHYEFWMDKFDDGCYVTRMPYKYAVECLCDYLGANKAYNGKNASYIKECEWWESQKDKKAMHPDIKEFLDAMFNLLKYTELEDYNKYYSDTFFLNKKFLKSTYNYVLILSDYKDQVKLSDIKG